jgi:hypothetical protein
MTSATGVPVSACYKAKEICSSLNLPFFTACSFLAVVTLPENSHSRWRRKAGGRQLDPARAELVWCNPTIRSVQ